MDVHIFSKGFYEVYHSDIRFHRSNVKQFWFGRKKQYFDIIFTSFLI